MSKFSDPRWGSPTFDAIHRRESHRDGERFTDDHLRRSGFTPTFFDYELPDGTLVYQSCRYEQTDNLRPGVDIAKKRFLVRRPLPYFDRRMNIGECLFGAGERRVIYNWPAVMKAGPGATVFVCEGEKNAADLTKHGLLATTVLSHEWTDECAAALTGCDLIILEDYDDNGRKIAAAARKKLAGVAKSTRVISLDHLWKRLAPEKAANSPPVTGDVSDWLSEGGDPAKLLEICREVPVDGAFAAKVHEFVPEEEMQPWNFLYGKHLLRGTVSVTSGAGEVGKSTKSISEALAMASGKPILGIEPLAELRVLLVNLEDDRNAVDKRVAAAMKHHQLSPDDIGGRLFTVAKGEVKLKLATQTRIGVIDRDESAVRGLVEFLRDKQIDVCSIDPLRKTHRVNENDNVAMGEVIEVHEDIAAAASCATHLWHHVRKGNGGDTTVESARGASSIVDAPRSIEIAEKMTKDEAAKLGVNAENRRRYFKTYNGKLNFAPPVEQMKWFELKSVELANGFPFGDSVGVVCAWQPPAVRAQELSQEAIEGIRDAVGREPRWKQDVRADMWVGKAVAPVLDLSPDGDKEAVKRVLEALMKKKVLKTVTAMDRGRRQEKVYVVVV
jgi:hypothetical protein